MRIATPLTILLLFCLMAQAHANAIHITPSDALQNIIDNVEPNAVIVLSPGTYYGNFIINRSLTLEGQDGVIINANGKSNAISINAENVTIKNLAISHWGDDLTEMNAGIFCEPEAHNLLIENNHLYGPAFGIWLKRSPNALVRSNRVQGDSTIRSQDKGNGIHLSGVTGAIIDSNEVWNTRDGIYIESSNNNRIIGNRLHDLRYGVHYMYSQNNVVSSNHTHSTRTGFALMQSKGLTVTDNISVHDLNYGILLNFITDSTLTGNKIYDVRAALNPDGGSIMGAQGKAMFVYNAQYNLIHNNLLYRSDIGIHITAGSEDNRIFGNAFVHNKNQVKYVANRTQDWSENEKGNYWSDYMGWDLNNDDIGDIPFEPNDEIDKLLWKYPLAKLLINSPAVATLRWVQRQFPVLKTAGVTDSFPLMNPPISQTSFDIDSNEVHGEVL